MTVSLNREALQNLVLEVANLLDEGKFTDWLAKCTPDFTYEITAFSDEIDKKVLWMSEDRNSLGSLMENVRFHEQYPGRLRRHVGLLRIVSNGGQDCCAESPVVIWHTNSHGTTQPLAIAKYVDRFRLDNGEIAFSNREVLLDTRRLAIGCHVAL